MKAGILDQPILNSPLFPSVLFVSLLSWSSKVTLIWETHWAMRKVWELFCHWETSRQMRRVGICICVYSLSIYLPRSQAPKLEILYSLLAVIFRNQQHKNKKYCNLNPIHCSWLSVENSSKTQYVEAARVSQIKINFEFLLLNKCLYYKL